MNQGFKTKYNTSIYTYDIYLVQIYMYHM